MLHKIIGGIAKNILAEFGALTKVFSEEVSQGFIQPCFVIKIIKSQIQPGIGGRRKYVNSFLIQYFPKSDMKNFDMELTSKRLFDCLEYIKANNRILKGVNMKAGKGSAVNINSLSTNYENGDGILNLYVDYNFHEVVSDDSELMKKLVR